MVLEPVYDFAMRFFSMTPAQIGLIILSALVLQAILKATIDRAVERMVRAQKHPDELDEKKREQTLSKMFKTASAVVIWVIAVLLVLWQLNINVAALATGAGLIGIVVGFGAQNSIKDILAGVFIIAENQYRLGDIVSLYAAGKDVAGVVEDITIRITRLRDLDGNTHIVPNGSISVMTNLSFHFANVNVDVRVSYRADIDKVERVINEVGAVLSEDARWKPHIFEPIAYFRVDGFDESAVRIKALGKVEPAKQWEIAGEFRRRLKKAFETEDIEIPYTQVVVHQAPTKKPR